MKKKFLCLFLCLLFLITGCSFNYSNMDNINVVTSVYPIEYITNRLYGNNSKIISIYPKSSNIDTYNLTDKQINDFSKNNLFIYNGDSKEREYAKSMINKNRNLKIIDATSGIDTTMNTDAWLNPANMIMIANNISKELINNITSNYIINEIKSNYELIKLDMTELETELKIVADNSKNTQIISYDESLLFLNKYGFNVINLTEKGNKNEKNILIAQKLFEEEKLSYLFVMENIEDDVVINDFVDNYGAKKTTIKSLSTVTESDITNKKDYITIMNDTINLIKQETY